MAKALSGHIAVGPGTDARLLSEVVRLRARVRELEEELAARDARALCEEAARMADVLGDHVATEPVIELDRATPALR